MQEGPNNADAPAPTRTPDFKAPDYFRFQAAPFVAPTESAYSARTNRMFNYGPTQAEIDAAQQKHDTEQARLAWEHDQALIEASRYQLQNIALDDPKAPALVPQRTGVKELNVAGHQISGNSDWFKKSLAPKVDYNAQVQAPYGLGMFERQRVERLTQPYDRETEVTTTPVSDFLNSYNTPAYKRFEKTIAESTERHQDAYLEQERSAKNAIQFGKKK